MLKRLFASRKRPYIPGFDTPETIEFDLSGNKLSLTLPPHSDYENFEARQAPITQLNIYDESHYNEPEKPFACSMFVQRNWELYGAFWKNRPEGSITFTALVEKANCLPDGMSCFNPNHFEQVVEHLIYKMGPGSPNFGPRKAPVNWKINKQKESLWVMFEVQKDLSKSSAPEPFTLAQYSSFIYTPLDDKYYLMLAFRNLGYAPSSYAIRNMNLIRNRVLSSAKLTLNSSAKKRLQAVTQRWPDASITNQRQPENWQYPEWRDGDTTIGEPNIVIVKPGSPAPQFNP